jgi:RHS repeat-associated protein
VMGRGDGQSAYERHDYFPYGEEMISSANNRDKFGTYSRDGHSGLDYADQRYYASRFGRFRTSDPYEASGGASEPGSWNRYPYVGGDPVNWHDPLGLMRQQPQPLPLPTRPGEEPPSPGTPGAGTGCALPDQGVVMAADSCGLDPEGDGGAPGRISSFDILAQQLQAGRSLVNQTLSSGKLSSQCEELLNNLKNNAGITLSRVLEAVNGAEFKDGATSTERVCDLYATDTADPEGYQYFCLTKPNLTFAQFLKSNKTTGAMAALPGSRLANQIFFNTNAPHIKKISVSGSAGLIAHEVLHNLGLTDPLIYDALGGASVGLSPSSPTAQYSQIFEQRCFK